MAMMVSSVAAGRWARDWGSSQGPWSSSQELTTVSQAGS